VNKKVIIIAAAAVLLLGGGGAGAFFFLGQKPAEAKAEDDHGKSAGGHGGGHGEAKPETRRFVTVDNLNAPLAGSVNRNEWVFFEISLEVKNDDDKKTLVVKMPRLRDAFLREIYARTVLKQDGSGQVDIDGVRSRFLKAANQVAGSDVVLDVLVTKTFRTRV